MSEKISIFARVIRYWLPQSIKSIDPNDPHQVTEYFKGAMLVVVSLTTPLLAPVVMTSSKKWGLQGIGIWGPIVAAVVTLLAAPILKFTNNRSLSSSIFLVAFMLNAVSVLWTSGGVNSPGIVLLFFIPIFGTFLVGPRGGIFWTVLTAVVVLSFFTVSHLGWLPTSQIHEEYVEEARLMSFLASMGACSVIFFGERLRESLQSKLIEANKAIQSQYELNLRAARLSAVSDLSAGVAHEINNPLAIIRADTTTLNRIAASNMIEDPL